MKQRMLILSSLMLAGTLYGGIAHAAEEDVSTTDPGRWFKAEDTPDGRYKNLRIEANAAYGEALRACQDVKGKQARQCRDEARGYLKEDMARAKRIYEHAKANP